MCVYVCGKDDIEVALVSSYTVSTDIRIQVWISSDQISALPPYRRITGRAAPGAKR